MDTTLDYYALLDVPRDANADQIVRAYKREARRAHPDVGGDANVFAQLTQARDVLTNAAARARYDAARVSTRPTPPPPPPTPQQSGPSRPRRWPSQQQPGQRTRATIYGQPPDQLPAARKLTRVLELLPLPDHCFLFHQAGGLDHVIVAGNRLLTISVVGLPAGTWLWDRNARRPTRNGQHHPGLDQACAAAGARSEQLVDRLGWADAGLEWARLLVLAPDGDNEPRGLDTSQFAHPDLDTVRSDQAARWLDRWWQHAHDGAPAGHLAYSPIVALEQLRAATTSPGKVLTVHPPAATAPRLPSDLRVQPPAPAGAGIYAVAALAAATFTATAAMFSTAATMTLAVATACTLAGWVIWASRRTTPAVAPSLPRDLARAAGITIDDRFEPNQTELVATIAAAAITIIAVAVADPGVAAAAITLAAFTAAGARPMWQWARTFTAHTGRTVGAVTDRHRSPLVVHVLRAHPSDPARPAVLDAVRHAGAEQLAAATTRPR